MEEKTVCVCVYRDTIEEHEDEWNLTDVITTMKCAVQYYKEYIEPYCAKEDIEWENAEDFWLNHHTADDTQDFYEYAMKHNAVIRKENW